MRTPSSRFRVTARPIKAMLALGLAGALITGCGGGSQPGESPGGSSAPSAEGPLTHQVWPLTGLDAKGAEITHRPIVAKIDNTESARGQVGLNRADLITEELVEGGLTRLAVFFDSRLPTAVGPVRSMRASDIGVVKPVDAVVVASGAAEVTYPRLKQAGVTYFSEDKVKNPGFRRDPGRRLPYNVLANLRSFAKQVGPPNRAPGTYLNWGKSSDFNGALDGTTIAARFSSGHTTNWSFQDGKYVNTNSFAEAGQDFRPVNVIVVRVEQGDAGYTDPAGNPVPETKYTGTGEVVVFHGGKALRGTWSKKNADSPLALRTKAGPIKVPAGRTWIELVPVDGAGGGLSFQ